MISSTKVTISVVLSAMAVLIGWDIYVASNDVDGDTISEITLMTAYSHPSLGLAWGILAGHLAWPRRKPIFGRKPWTAFLVGLMVLALFGIEFLIDLKIAPIMPLLPGILLGHWLWPQIPSSLMSS